MNKTQIIKSSSFVIGAQDSGSWSPLIQSLLSKLFSLCIDSSPKIRKLAQVTVFNLLENYHAENKALVKQASSEISMLCSNEIAKCTSMDCQSTFYLLGLLQAIIQFATPQVNSIFYSPFSPLRESSQNLLMIGIKNWREKKIVPTSSFQAVDSPASVGKLSSDSADLPNICLAVFFCY